MWTISAYVQTAWDTLLKSRQSHLRTAHMHTERSGIAAFVLGSHSQVSTGNTPPLSKERWELPAIKTVRCNARSALKAFLLRIWCNTCTSEFIRSCSVTVQVEHMSIHRFDPFCCASYDSLAGFHLQGDACLQDVCGKGLHMVDGTCSENLCFCPFGAEATGFPIADNYADHALSKKLLDSHSVSAHHHTSTEPSTGFFPKTLAEKTRQIALQMS